MKSFPKIFIAPIFLGFFIPVLVFAQSLSLPNQFFGSVNFTNGVAPDGLVVEAKIRNGPVVGNSVTAGGNYGYNLNHNPNLLFALDNQGVYAGETVDFYVSGIKANETAVFVNGESTNLNLTISGTVETIEKPEPEPEPEPDPEPSPAPAGGGGGGGSYTPSATSSSTIQGDINGDDKVDKYDFALMMANWGKTGSNDSDLNDDNKVDKYDFALLMVNWGI